MLKHSGPFRAQEAGMADVDLIALGLQVYYLGRQFVAHQFYIEIIYGNVIILEIVPHHVAPELD